MKHVLEHAPAMENRVLLLQAHAEIVVLKKRKICKVIEAIQAAEARLMTLLTLLKQMTVAFQNADAALQEETVVKHTSRKSHLEALRQNLDLEQNALSLVENSIDQFDGLQKDDDLRRAVENERQRLCLLAESVSKHEERINAMQMQKNAMEDELEKILVEEKARALNLDHVAQQVSNYVQSNSEEEHADLHSRIDVLKKLHLKLREVQEVANKVITRYCQAEHMQVAVQQLNELFVVLFDHVPQMAQFVATIKQHNEELNTAFLQRQNMQQMLDKLHEENRHVQTSSSASFDTLRRKKLDLETKLSEFKNQEAAHQAAFSKRIAPMNEMSNTLLKNVASAASELDAKKYALNERKNQFDNQDAAYNASISQLRAKQQHISHKMNLKQQQKNVVVNHAHSGNAPELTSEAKISYLDMYMKKKDKLGTTFDSELYDAVMKESEQQVLQEIEQVDTRLRYKLQPEDKPIVMVKLFGPHSKAMEEQRAQEIVQVLSQMQTGCLVTKRKEASKTQRLMVLSSDFTRIEIRDPKKKIAESFGMYEN